MIDHSSILYTGKIRLIFLGVLSFVCSTAAGSINPAFGPTQALAQSYGGDASASNQLDFSGNRAFYPDTVFDPFEPDYSQRRATRVARENVVDPGTTGSVTRGQSSPGTYEPFGFDIGSWRLTPYMQNSFGSSSNDTQSPDGKQRIFWENEIGANLERDNGDGKAEINAGFTTRNYFDDGQFQFERATLNGFMDRGLQDGLRLRVDGGYTRAREDMDNVPPGTLSDPMPIRENLTGSVELYRERHRLDFSLRALIERNAFEGKRALFIDDKTVYGTQAFRDNTYYHIEAGATYNSGGLLNPFAEISLGWRQFDHDLACDLRDISTGNLSSDCPTVPGGKQNSSIVAGKLGVQIDRGPIFNGRAMVSLNVENFEDSARPSEEIVRAEIDLNWSPVRDFNIGLEGSIACTSASSGSGGASSDCDELVQNAALSADKRINERFSINGEVGFNRTVVANADPLETNETKTGMTSHIAGGLEFRFNRHLSFLGSVTYERFNAEDDAEDWRGLTLRSAIRTQY